MNIKEAKEQIKNAMTAYFTKDANGDYIVPIEKQRPVFLMGPPGIGKTGIMEQIASEMGVGLLTYSMTHHTRQSALGLPFIQHKEYKGFEYDVSEYTMSEIIASVYDMMKTTGVEEGILFLDEINCVSETLAPVMLQFLQYKVFGRHCVPKGWIVVTAGNPPEYNNSVREFDIVTWDRLKRIDVEPDFDVWKEYAYNKGVHPTVMTYLEIRKADFYSVESTVEGKTFVTARGWDDLSQMLGLYEINHLPVDEKLISQYVQNPRISKEFAAYYDLYQKYKSDYQVEKILGGKASDLIKNRAQEAQFDERLSLLGMLMDSVGESIRIDMATYLVLKELTASLMRIKENFTRPVKKPVEYVDEQIHLKREKLESGKRASSLSKETQRQIKDVIHVLEDQAGLIRSIQSYEDAFNTIKKDYDTRVKDHNKSVKAPQKRLSNLFGFIEQVYGEGQEMLIVVTELTASGDAVAFISQYGCDEYFKHNKNLLVYDRRLEIEQELKKYKLD